MTDSDAAQKHEDPSEQLLTATRAGDTEIVDNLLRAYDTTPSATPSLPTIQQLLSTKDPLSGNSPLHLCSANGHKALALKLIAHGAPLDARNASGSTPLHYASLTGHVQIVQALLAKGASPVVENDFGRTALDEALGARKEEVAKCLMRFVEEKAGKRDDTDQTLQLKD